MFSLIKDDCKRNLLLNFNWKNIRCKKSFGYLIDYTTRFKINFFMNRKLVGGKNWNIMYSRSFEWGFPGFPGPGGGGGPPGGPSSVAPATADLIAQQSQV